MAGKSGREINATPQNVWKSRILSWEGILVVIFLAVLIFCKCLTPSTYNFKNVFREMPKFLSEVLLFLPMAYILMLGEIDISVGSTVCLAATMGVLASGAGVPVPVALIIMLAVGTICGFINGIIIVKFPELPSMIVTLGTQIIFRGIAEIALGDGGSATAKCYDFLKQRIGIIPWMFYLVVILAVIFVIVSVKMRYGRELMAIGSNRKTAFYSGIKVNSVILRAYVLMGLFCGLSAMFLVSVSGGANTTTAEGLEMNAISMAVFGGIATTGGKGKMFGGIVAAFIIVCLRIGLSQVNTNGQVILLIIGVLLICAVLLPNIGTIIKQNQKRKAV